MALAGCTEKLTDSNPCPNGWDNMGGFNITGYYAPTEEEFDGKSKKVKVNGVWRTINADFLDAVSDHDGNGEGWGRTQEGDFIGYYDNHWSSSPHPLDEQGNELRIGTVAVDPAMIEPGSQVMILTLPETEFFDPDTVFSATDTGTQIRDKHIDIYTGVGPEAREAMFTITSLENAAEVCILGPSDQ